MQMPHVCSVSQKEILKKSKKNKLKLIFWTKKTAKEQKFKRKLLKLVFLFNFPIDL